MSWPPPAAESVDDVLADLGHGDVRLPPPPVVVPLPPLPLQVAAPPLRAPEPEPEPEPVTSQVLLPRLAASPMPLTPVQPEPPPPPPEPVPRMVSVAEAVPEMASDLRIAPSPPPQPPRIDAATVRSIIDAPAEELVVDARTGRVRQAGAVQDEGRWVLDYRTLAERELYVFTKGIMHRDYLTPGLHLPVCRYLTTARELLDPLGLKALGLLFPREHGKSSIVSQGMPAHMFIQPKEHNIYFPGTDGSETRIILCCETERRATDHGRVVRTTFESNKILRALWPHRVFPGKGKGDSAWNNQEFILPRDKQKEWADPTFRAIGVDGSLTGSHPSGLIKDDLISEKAANSATVMEGAYSWHITSRALINNDECREWIIGTRWSINDIYERMLREDRTVHIWRRAIVEDAAPIWPERFSLAKIDALRTKFGVWFPLLYMNSAADPSLVDFNMDEVRTLRIVGRTLEFDELPIDTIMQSRRDDAAKALDVRVGTDDSLRGQRLTSALYDKLAARHEYLRFKAA